MKVYISYGHRGSGTGAKKHVDEGSANIIMGQACVAYLKNYPIKVYADTLKTEVVEEVNMANNYKVDLAVSIHNNAGGGDGFEALVYNSANSAGAIKYAKLAEKEIKKIGQNSRGIKQRPDLWFLKATNMQAVILEGAFVDNIIDKTIIDTKAEQQKFGYAYAKAILAYAGITDKGYQNNKKTTTTLNKPTTPSKPTASKKTVDQLAQEVMAGKWGNDPVRSQKLKAAGYDPKAVQAKVNVKIAGNKPTAPKKTIDQLAKEVWQGKWGNGQDRINRLTKAGYNPKAVQDRVNKLYG